MWLTPVLTIVLCHPICDPILVKVGRNIFGHRRFQGWLSLYDLINSALGYIKVFAYQSSILEAHIQPLTSSTHRNYLPCHLRIRREVNKETETGNISDLKEICNIQFSFCGDINNKIITPLQTLKAVR